MKLKATEFEIVPEKPFQNDALNLEESAKALTELLKSSAEESLVLSINAEWGNGKTTFLKMWEQHLKNEKFNTLYFSAWENDFSDNALISLIGELQCKMNEFFKKENSKIQDSLDTIKKLSKKLSKKALPVTLKIATMGVIDLDEKQIEKALADFSEKIAEEQLKDYENAKNTIKGFKEALGKFVKELNEKNNTEEKTQNYPLVIFIDELDRCRPLYAIELLEKIKHIFNISGIVFVLAMDKKQLGYSICSVYGQGLNVDGYLRRFIDLEYNLPQPNSNNIEQLIKQQVESFELKDIYVKNQTVRNTVGFFKFLIIVFELTLREQEHFFKQLSAIIKLTSSDVQLNISLTALLISLKIKKTDLYENFVTNKDFKANEIVEYLSTIILERNIVLQDFITYIHELYIQVIRCHIIFHRNFDTAKKEKEKLLAKIPSQYYEEIKFSPHLSDNWISHNLGNNILKETIKRIDIASNFS